LQQTWVIKILVPHPFTTGLIMGRVLEHLALPAPFTALPFFGSLVYGQAEDQAVF